MRATFHCTQGVRHLFAAFDLRANQLYGLAPLRFKQVLVRLHPGERRGVTLLIDPDPVRARHGGARRG